MWIKSHPLKVRLNLIGRIFNPKLIRLQSSLVSVVKIIPQVTSRDQGLQNWTGYTLETIKLIEMNSRFTKIFIKAQKQK